MHLKAGRAGKKAHENREIRAVILMQEDSSWESLFIIYTRRTCRGYFRLTPGTRAARAGWGRAPTYSIIICAARAEVGISPFSADIQQDAQTDS